MCVCVCMCVCRVIGLGCVNAFWKNGNWYLLSLNDRRITLSAATFSRDSRVASALLRTLYVCTYTR